MSRNRPPERVDVGDRRRPGVARGNRDDFESADRALGDALAQRGEIGIEAAIEADHQRRAGLLDDFEAGANALDIEMDRLLAEDRLFGARGALDEIGVGVGRRADGDGVDVLRGEDRVDFARPCPRRLGQGRRRRGIRVGDESHLAVGARRDIAAMDLADPTRADDPESHALLPLRAPTLCAHTKKEYTFHIDLGIEFLFHSGEPRTEASRLFRRSRPGESLRRKRPWPTPPRPRPARRRAPPIRGQPI